MAGRLHRLRSSLIVILIAGPLVMPAKAGHVNGAHVIAVDSLEADAFIVYVDQTVVNPASCGTQTVASNRFAVQASTPGGKAQIATLLEAMVTSKLVWINGRAEYPTIFVGTAQCNVWPDTESINYVHVNN